jgi:hypothetical protein
MIMTAKTGRRMERSEIHMACSYPLSACRFGRG